MVGGGVTRCLATAWRPRKETGLGYAGAGATSEGERLEGGGKGETGGRGARLAVTVGSGGDWAARGSPASPEGEGLRMRGDSGLDGRRELASLEMSSSRASWGSLRVPTGLARAGVNERARLRDRGEREASGLVARAGGGCCITGLAWPNAGESGGIRGPALTEEAGPGEAGGSGTGGGAGIKGAGPGGG